MRPGLNIYLDTLAVFLLVTILLSTCFCNRGILSFVPIHYGLILVTVLIENTLTYTGTVVYTINCFL